MKVKCNQYKMDDEISIYEFERDDKFEYYVEDSGTMIYSFGWYKKNNPSRFSEEDLTALFENGYCDPQIEDMAKLEYILEEELNELLGEE